MKAGKCPICNSNLPVDRKLKNLKLVQLNCNKCGWHIVKKIDLVI